MLGIATLALVAGCEGAALSEVLVSIDTDLRLVPGEGIEACAEGAPGCGCVDVPAELSSLDAEPCQVRLVELCVVRPEDGLCLGPARAPIALTRPAEERVRLPVTVGVAADPSRLGEVELVAMGFLRGSGEPALVTQRARVELRRGEVRVMCMHLGARCAGAPPCADGTTCRATGDGHECVPIDVDEDALPELDGDALARQREPDAPPPPCPLEWPG